MAAGNYYPPIILIHISKMKDLRCPNCGKIFKIDEAEYTTILEQVKNEAFNAELDQRIEAISSRIKAEEDLAQEKIKNELSAKILEKDKTISELDAKIKQHKSDLEIALMKVESKSEKDLQAKVNEINQLKSQIQLEKEKAENEKNSLNKTHDQQIKLLEEQVAYYKENKLRLSTKMVGESLEQHCSNLYNQNLRMVLPTAYFEKDNDAVDHSKGDFIFRDSIDGTEYISIMFEMKNESADTISKKHRNEDFLKTLDSNRKKKNCEYAVLVSMLEPDNDLYNSGIVDVSNKYPKMYVIRPQFFITIIGILRQAALNSYEYKKQLDIAKSQSVDVANFEDKLFNAKNIFSKHYNTYCNQYDTAIKKIDDVISDLQKLKDNLTKSGNSLRLANNNIQELSIKELTRNNPTMQEKFNQIKK